MPRRAWPGDGIGRGNGTGSRRTQFKPGMPSGNPNGRPRKPKLAPDASLKDAALRVLLEPVVTTEGGVRRKLPRADAMLKLLVASFPDCDAREKLAILKYLGVLVPEAQLAGAPRRITANAVQDFVAALAREGLIDNQG